MQCPDEVEWRKYWGGDITGLEEKLGYLNHLGVSAVWVTPLMESVRAYEGGTAYGTGYHGYWVQNYDRPSAHFGTWDDVSSLSTQLNARSMHYIQDITLNHSNPYDNHVFGKLFRSEDADRIFIDSYDDDVDPKTVLRAYKHFEDDVRCKAAKPVGMTKGSGALPLELINRNRSGPNEQPLTVKSAALVAN